MLNHATERPLLYEETVPLLEHAGLRSIRYQTHGFFGFCLFMNSDVRQSAVSICAEYPSDHPRVNPRGGSDPCVAGFAASRFASCRNGAKNSWAVKFISDNPNPYLRARVRNLAFKPVGMSLNLTMM